VAVETSRAFACIGPKWVSMRELQVERDAFSTMVVKLLASCSSAGVQVRKTIPNYRVSALPVAAGVRILSGASRGLKRKGMGRNGVMAGGSRPDKTLRSTGECPRKDVAQGCGS